MNSTVLQVDRLSKCYRLRHKAGQFGYRTLREDLAAWPGAVWKRLRARSEKREEFWALKDVSFSVSRGEVLGVIGRNGAGKSTLLKILSRVVDPSAGVADLSGRVGSLLEVGTGFHPELTGRENIFLSGALLGMRRREVNRHFDEIVSFAEVEQFLDTPCKHYSSGMYTRLGFAVAAHLNTDILLVDEVLAVGDAGFQRKCLGKVSKVADGGRTVLFVSHNMAAVKQLCSRGLVLEDGQVSFCGDVDAAVLHYQEQFTEAGSGGYTCSHGGDAPAWIAGARLHGPDGRPTGCLTMSDPMEVEVDIECVKPLQLALSLQVRESGQSPLLHLPSADTGQIIPYETGRHRVKVVVPPVMLYPGVYGLRLALTEIMGAGYEVHDQVDKLTVTVEQDPVVCLRPLVRQAGVIFVRPKWDYLGRV